MKQKCTKTDKLQQCRSLSFLLLSSATFPSSCSKLIMNDKDETKLSLEISVVVSG